MTTTNTGDNPLWQFSLQVYAAPGMAAACLALQQRHAIDVNLLLYALWRGEYLSRAELLAVEQAVADWRAQVVLPIRALRQDLRDYPGVEPARELIKQAEVRAEKSQQQFMFETLSEEASKNRGSAEGIEQALELFVRTQALPPATLQEVALLARSAIQNLER